MAVTSTENVLLKNQVTFKTGGPARYFVEVYTEVDVEEAVAFAEAKGLPFFVLGGGSNLLVADDGYAGVIIKMNIQGITYSHSNSDEVAISVGAGVLLDTLVADTVDKNIIGLENLSHIPGTVGATPVQNVGAYGVEVGEYITNVRAYDTDAKKIITLSNAECSFTYRHSIFKEKNNLIILSVDFLLMIKEDLRLSYADLALLTKDTVDQRAVRDAVIRIRSEKFPDWNVVGTAGSFFKNPIVLAAQASDLCTQYPELPQYKSDNGMVKLSLGYILDKICNLKGFAIGPVRLYEKQALVLVVERGATTTDVKNFVEIIKNKVFEKTKIKIIQEVTEI